MLTSEIAELIGGELIGEDREITGVARLEEAGTRDVSFVANARYERMAEDTAAGALIVDPTFAIKLPDRAYIRVADPYRGFMKVVARMVPEAPCQPTGVDPTAVIASDVALGADVSIGANVVLGAGAVIGDRSTLYPGVVVCRGVRIGADVTIFPNVSIYYGTEIGDRVVIHAGAVIGADGFGFLPTADGSWEKIPQVGGVSIGDDVEIGANVTIDRAMIGQTVVERGVKLDNLVHIAHNATIGERTAIAAQAGISGSTRIGEGNMIAGQVGVVGHIETAPGVIIEAQAGVSKSIRKAGRYFGHPAKEHSMALRQEGALRQLPELLLTIRRLVERVEQLEAATGTTPGTDAD